MLEISSVYFLGVFPFNDKLLWLVLSYLQYAALNVLFFFLLFSWKEAIEVKDDEGFCMMKKLIEKLPEVAKVKNIMDTKK